MTIGTYMSNPKLHNHCVNSTYYLRVNIDLIISSKGRIKKRTFTVMLHNQTAMSVSMVTKGKRY